MGGGEKAGVGDSSHTAGANGKVFTCFFEGVFRILGSGPSVNVSPCGCRNNGFGFIELYLLGRARVRSPIFHSAPYHWAAAVRLLYQRPTSNPYPSGWPAAEGSDG